MSQIDLNKFKAAVGSFQDRADGKSAAELKKDAGDQKAEKTAKSQDDLLKKINDYIEKNELSSLIAAKRDERGVIRPSGSGFV